ncbi:ABC transporter permease [Edaphobacter acidisoli]|uniref:ABC transporter permease n=1 Tax=Edaphobacter acidisoli TaxID=2040573 RepID=A0A916RXQ1_9BACT|nr:ABC transporter permease [Edaphobacter acidisoli]GGA72500.1 ABC transporter permease [Edaphobacter acidisoli]
MALSESSKPVSFERTLASARSTMLFSEVVKLAVDSFRTSKTRFLLTMLGMVIGSASIILVTTLGLTGKQYALDQLTSMGPNKIELQYGGGTVSGPNNTGTPDYMTLDDMNAVLQQVPGIVASSPMLEFHDNVAMGGGVTKATMLLGVSPQYKIVRNLVVVSGRFFDDQDALSHEKVADIVEPFAIALYGSPQAAIGHTISIKGIPFTVIGVFKEAFDTYGLSEISDQTMLVPYPVLRYFTGTNTLKEIFFTMRDSAMVVPASKRILAIIRSRHYAGSVYSAQILTDLLTSAAKIADMLTLVLTLGAGITLIVSGVGIMNSMLANVQSRIKEIGIRKALGATSNEIRLQFLTEAVFLSLSGGLVGTLLGLAIPFTLGLLTPFKIPISSWSAVIALGTSVLVGVLFGTLPANRAARLDPVQTLKYE